MADGEPIVIKELEGIDGSGLGVGLQVSLDDSSLPEQLQSSSKLRAVRTHYPGASSGSTQIMGIEDDDIVLEGQFRDVWLGEQGAALFRFRGLRRLLLNQRFCQLSWGTTLVRRGYVKEVDQTFRRGADIGYRLVFQVDESDDAAVIAPKPFEPDSPADLDTALQKLEDLLDAAGTAVDVLNLVQAVV